MQDILEHLVRLYIDTKESYLTVLLINKEYYNAAIKSSEYKKHTLPLNHLKIALRRHPGKPWNWKLLPSHPCMTMDMLREYKNKYVFNYAAGNPNISLEYVDEHLQKIGVTRFNYLIGTYSNHNRICLPLAIAEMSLDPPHSDITEICKLCLDDTLLSALVKNKCKLSKEFLANIPDDLIYLLTPELKDDLILCKFGSSMPVYMLVELDILSMLRKDRARERLSMMTCVWIEKVFNYAVKLGIEDSCNWRALSKYYPWTYDEFVKYRNNINSKLFKKGVARSFRIHKEFTPDWTCSDKCIDISLKDIITYRHRFRWKHLSNNVHIGEANVSGYIEYYYSNKLYDDEIQRAYIWDWFRLSKNKALSASFILRTIKDPRYTYDYSKLSLNPNLTFDIIDELCNVLNYDLLSGGYV